MFVKIFRANKIWNVNFQILRIMKGEDEAYQSASYATLLKNLLELDFSLEEKPLSRLQ